MLGRVNILYALLYITDFLLDPLIDFQQPVTNSLHCREIHRICCGNICLCCRWGIRPIQVDAHSVCQLCYLLPTLGKPQSYRAQIDVAHSCSSARRLLLATLAGLPIKLCILHTGALTVRWCGLILPSW